MTEVQGVALDAGSNPIPSATIHIALVTSSASTPGYTGSGEIVQTYQTSASQTGAWSATLTPNSAITPTNTYYTVTEGRGAVSTIVVPATGGPYELSSLLVTPPPTPDAPGITGVQVAANGTVAGVRPEINLIAGTNVTVTAADNPSAGRVDVTINATGGGGGGAVDSVNGQTGIVVLHAADVSAIPASAEGAASGVATLDASGHLTAAQAANLLAAANNLSDLVNAATARANLGLGTAATASTSAFDGAGSAATAQTNAETFATNAVATETARAEAAEATKLTAADNLSDLTDNAAARGHLGLGSAATQNTSVFDPAGAAATAQSNAITAAEANAAATYLPLAGGTMSGAIAMGGSKITGGAAGTAGTDFATVSQLPASLPPSGTAGGDLGSTYPSPTVTGTHLAAPLPISQGGTGQGTQQAALTVLAGAQTAGRYLRSDGTNTTLAAIQAADVPTLNQSTTGTAAGLSSTLAVASGGTGQTSAQAALDALAGGVTSGSYLRGNGTHVALTAIQVGDVPTLNQSTSGTAAGLSATLAVTSGGTGQASRQAAINALTGAQSAGAYLRSDGTNATLATIQAADIPTLNQNTTGTAAGLSATLAIGSGGTGATTAIGARASLGEYAWDTPATRGLLEYNFPPQMATVSNNLVSGSIYGTTIIAQGNSAVTKVGVGVLSSAATPTSGQNLIGLYSISGTTATQIAVTGDLGTWNSQGFESYAFGAGQTLVAGNSYIILLMSNATTPVHLAGLSTTAGFPPMYNAGLSNTAAPWLKTFLYGTAQTALPASFTISGTTMASLNAQTPWVCLL